MDEIEIAKAVLVKTITGSFEPFVMEKYVSYRNKGFSPIASALLTDAACNFGENCVTRSLNYLEDKVK